MASVSEIYDTLTKKKYCRDLPHAPTEIRKRIQNSLLKNEPIKLIGFWGVGPKNKANWADLETLDFLAQSNEEVKEVYPPGIEFTFIFATFHASHNGINKETILAYTDDMKSLFKKYGFECLYLDDLWPKYGISSEKIEELFEAKESDWWNKIENAQLMEKNAKNRNIRLTPKLAAQKYYIMRDLEKELLEKEFPSSIFNVFSDSRLKNVLPNMPILYFYSRKGRSDAPWFVTGEKQAWQDIPD